MSEDGYDASDDDTLGDAIAARIAAGVDDLDEDAKRELTYELAGKSRFTDPGAAVKALRWSLDFRLESDDVDGDTITSHLIQMIAQTPDDDALLLEYLRAVADSGYAYTGTTLSDVLSQPGISPARAKRLALAATFVEEWCMAVSRTDPPQEWVVNALKRVFERAVQRGATASDWEAMRVELVAKKIGYEGQTAAGELERWTA